MFEPTDVSPASRRTEARKLRVLDSVRSECIREVNGALREVGAPEIARKTAHHRRKDRVRFYGNPYSLAGQYPRELSVRVAADEVATRAAIEVPASKKAS